MLAPNFFHSSHHDQSTIRLVFEKLITTIKVSPSILTCRFYLILRSTPEIHRYKIFGKFAICGETIDVLQRFAINIGTKCVKYDNYYILQNDARFGQNFRITDQ